MKVPEDTKQQKPAAKPAEQPKLPVPSKKIPAQPQGQPIKGHPGEFEPVDTQDEPEPTTAEEEFMKDVKRLFFLI